jgi:hypothetical protein
VVTAMEFFEAEAVGFPLSFKPQVAPTYSTAEESSNISTSFEGTFFNLKKNIKALKTDNKTLREIFYLQSSLMSSFCSAEPKSGMLKSSTDEVIFL